MLGVAIATAVFVLPTAIGAFPAVTEEMSKYPASTSFIIAGSTALLYGLIGAVFMGWRANTIACLLYTSSVAGGVPGPRRVRSAP